MNRRVDVGRQQGFLSPSMPTERCQVHGGPPLICDHVERSQPTRRLQQRLDHLHMALRTGRVQCNALLKTGAKCKCSRLSKHTYRCKHTCGNAHEQVM